jgi:hypothetical protein
MHGFMNVKFSLIYFVIDDPLDTIQEIWRSYVRALQVYL